MAPEHDGTCATVADGGRPYVEDQAVLAHGLRIVEAKKCNDLGRKSERLVRLHRARTEVERITHAGPRRRLWSCHESPGASDRATVVDALEGPDAVLHAPAELAGYGLDYDVVCHDGAPL